MLTFTIDANEEDEGHASETEEEDVDVVFVSCKRPTISAKWNLLKIYLDALHALGNTIQATGPGLFYSP